MNKYQETLKTLREKGYTNHFQPITLEQQYPNEFKILQKLVDQQSILEEYNVTPENIREVLLTGQMFRNQPTLDDCIKEWEERGWELIRHERRYIAFQNSEGTFITISNYSQTTYEKHWNGRSQGITLEEHNLIHKTLKALEVEK